MSEENDLTFLKSVSFESSNIAWFGYTVDNKELYVAFKNGSEYRYFDVPKTVFDDLNQTAKDGESVGKAFNRLVKKAGYEYERATENEEEQPVKEPKKYGVEVGMLWYDNNPKLDLEHKIMKAIHYYQEKYGASRYNQYDVLICESDLPEAVKPEDEYVFSMEAAYVEIIVDASILPNHFLVSESHV